MDRVVQAALTIAKSNLPFVLLWPFSELLFLKKKMSIIITTISIRYYKAPVQLLLECCKKRMRQLR